METPENAVTPQPEAQAAPATFSPWDDEVPAKAPNQALRPNRHEPPERAAARPTRQPLGARNRLTFPTEKLDPNYHYHIINDQDDRLALAQAGGYEFVTGTSTLGDQRAGEGGAIDSRVSKPVGGGTRGYLMRIPKEFYEEDQRAKVAATEETEKAIKPTASQYVPGGGTRVVTDT